jgi:hypothetical protein
MALYTLDHTTAASVLISIRNALDTEGLINTNHRDTTTNLILTTSRTSRVLRFNMATSSRLYFYYGSSYASADTINDSVTVNAVAAGTGASGAIIITDDLIAIAQWRGTTICSTIVIGKMTTLGTDFIGSWYFGNSTPLLTNAGTYAQCDAIRIGSPLVSPDGKYYWSEMTLLTTTYQPLATGVDGIKVLHRAPLTGQAYEISGNDIILPGGGCNLLTTYFDCSFLVTNGNIATT